MKIINFLLLFCVLACNTKKRPPHIYSDTPQNTVVTFENTVEMELDSVYLTDNKETLFTVGDGEQVRTFYVKFNKERSDQLSVFDVYIDSTLFTQVLLKERFQVHFKQDDSTINISFKKNYLDGFYRISYPDTSGFPKEFYRKFKTDTIQNNRL